jgi:MtN3 and saliva related transmembrane protein
MKPADVIGWASSVVLVLTIAKQIHKQWQAGTSEGVSKWLFIGQLAASSGFTVYSWLIHSWVFVVTNSLMVTNALVGWWLTTRQKHEAAGEEGMRAEG